MSALLSSLMSALMLIRLFSLGVRLAGRIREADDFNVKLCSDFTNMIVAVLVLTNVACLIGIQSFSEIWALDAVFGVVTVFSLGFQWWEGSLISAPPGTWGLRAAQFFYSRETYEHVFKPVVADTQYEYFEALAHGRSWQARWIRIRLGWLLFESALQQLPWSLILRVASLWKTFR